MKTALVTGVLGGIGRATADRFAAAGWRVVGVDRRALADGDAAVWRYARLDLSQVGTVDALERLIADVDRLDALVNNAAVQIKKPIAQLSIEEWDLLFATNVRAAFLASRAAYGQLARTRGAIVNVASVHASATSPGMAAYAATKGALVALTRACATEFGEAGIRVNAVLPGAVDTPMLHAGLVGDTEVALRRLRERTPLGRIGTPDEIAGVVLFLANEDSAFITGEALVADGGVLSRLGSE